MSRINIIKSGETVSVIMTTDMVAEFKTMVARAMNTWQDPSPDMRDFADRALGRSKIMGSNMKEGAAGVKYAVYKDTVKPFKCHECRTVPCTCTFKHY